MYLLIRKMGYIVIWVMLGVFFSATIISWISYAQNGLSSCDGIEHYYTNTSFMNDYQVLWWDYDECYSIDEGSSLELLLKSPRVVINCTEQGYDCEDFSHAINCLAKKYDIECELYGTVGINHPGHSGIKCLYDGDWEEFN